MTNTNNNARRYAAGLWGKSIHIYSKHTRLKPLQQRWKPVGLTGIGCRSGRVEIPRPAGQTEKKTVEKPV